MLESEKQENIELRHELAVLIESNQYLTQAVLSLQAKLDSALATVKSDQSPPFLPSEEKTEANNGELPRSST